MGSRPRQTLNQSRSSVRPLRVSLLVAPPTEESRVPQAPSRAALYVTIAASSGSALLADRAVTVLREAVAMNRCSAA